MTADVLLVAAGVALGLLIAWLIALVVAYQIWRDS